MKAFAQGCKHVFQDINECLTLVSNVEGSVLSNCKHTSYLQVRIYTVFVLVEDHQLHVHCWNTQTEGGCTLPVSLCVHFDNAKEKKQQQKKPCIIDRQQRKKTLWCCCLLTALWAEVMMIGDVLSSYRSVWCGTSDQHSNQQIMHNCGQAHSGLWGTHLFPSKKTGRWGTVYKLLLTSLSRSLVLHIELSFL